MEPPKCRLAELVIIALSSLVQVLVEVYLVLLVLMVSVRLMGLRSMATFGVLRFSLTSMATSKLTTMKKQYCLIMTVNSR